MVRSTFIGKVLRGYQIEESIGSGGFGDVLRAYQPSIGRTVAIKTVLPQYANRIWVVQRFGLEARLIARVEHPNIVPVYDYWRNPSGAYMVMRYYPRGSLKNLIENSGPLSLERTTRLLGQLAAALDTAYAHGIVHKDVKPANILLDEQDNAYLADFGIAYVIGNALEESTDEHLVLSPAYSAPELLRQSQPPSLQSDIYSLAFVVYEMLTAEHPFGKLNGTQMVTAHLQKPIPMLQQVPSLVNDALQRATLKHPDDRFNMATDFAEAIQAAVQANSIRVSDSEESIRIKINPYRGLRAFGEADQQNFFGRETLVEELLHSFKSSDDRTLLAIVGPSGSGKSSIVHAGIVPAIRQGKLQDSNRWFIASMTPGNDPRVNLAEALLDVAITNMPEKLPDVLASDPSALVEMLHAMLPH